MTRPLIPSLALVLALASVLSACGDAEPKPSFLPEGDATIVALGSDFVSTSVMSFVVMPQLFLEVAGVDGVASTDPVVRHQGNYLIVINRFGFDNVTVLDARDFSLIGQVSTGAGSNPQDAAVLGDRLFVADAGGTGLSVISLNALESGATALDLSSLDPDDDIPNCHAVTIVAGKVWVSCGIRDDADDFLTPRGVGVVTIVDPDTGEIEDTLELEHTSPTGFFVHNPSAPELYLSTVPSFFDPASDGCIEVLGTGDPEHLGCGIDNEALGGYAAGMTWTDDGLLVSVTSGFDETDFGPLGSAVIVDPTAGTPSPVAFTATERVMDVAVCPTGERILGTITTGLRVFSADGIELTEDGLDIGAPMVQGGTTCL